MKKLLLLPLLAFFVTSITFGQIQIIDYNTGNQIQGDTVVYNIYSTQNQTNYMYIKNVSTNPADSLDKVKITRVKITETAGAGDYFCWGIVCYPESEVSPNNSYTSLDAITILIGDTSLLTYDYVPHNQVGVSQYRYYVVRKGGYLDSVDVMYTSVLGIEEQVKNSLSVYPNPTKGNLFVQADNAEGLNVKIIDMLGNEVYVGKMGSAATKIDVSQFKNGIYFVKLNSNSKAIVTKKIIVNN